MKTETLEALLIDRALGALPPEVDELIDAHLARDPEAARLADGLNATVRLARQAVAPQCAMPSRPLPFAQWRKRAMVQRWHARAWELSRLAAGVLLGLTLGWYARTGGGPLLVAAAPPPARPVPPAAVADQPGRTGSATDFWALSSFTAGQQARPAPDGSLKTRHRLHWESPVKVPHMEGNL
jgi:hypothetical protein